jgi:hypothetical protein
MPERIETERSVFGDRLVWIALAAFVLFVSGSMRKLIWGGSIRAIDIIFVAFIVGGLIWEAAKRPSRFGWRYIVLSCVVSAGVAVLFNAWVVRIGI